MVLYNVESSSTNINYIEWEMSFCIITVTWVTEEDVKVISVYYIPCPTHGKYASLSCIKPITEISVRLNKVLTQHLYSS